MIGELQIIFGVDAVALHLRVARQRLVFLMKLGRIAACAAVDPVAHVRIAAATLALATTTATATAAVLTIIDQAIVLVLKPKTGPAPGILGATPGRACA